MFLILKDQEIHRFMPFSTVRNAFKHAGRYEHPLNVPVNEIESVLRFRGHLLSREHLGQFNADKEAFPVITFADNDKPLSIIERMRIKLSVLIFPK